MAITDGLIEEELRKMVASGAADATAQTDRDIIAEATRRARRRAGLMTTNTPGAAAREHWASVLAAIRDAAAKHGE